jgi:deoxyribodipyrimidine photo-lyase
VRRRQSFGIFLASRPGAGVTVSVMVFTRDLRLGDNPALAAAAREGAVVPLFVLDEAILARTGGHANRLGFLHDSLHDLDTSLRARGEGS